MFLLFCIHTCFITRIKVHRTNNSRCYAAISRFTLFIGCGLNDRGSRVRFPAGAGNFSLHHRVQNGSGAHPASYSVPTGGFSLVIKGPGREADHSPPSSAEVKNAWSYTSTPQYVFVAWCLVKHRDNFTFFTFTLSLSSLPSILGNLTIVFGATLLLLLLLLLSSSSLLLLLLFRLPVLSLILIKSTQRKNVRYEGRNETKEKESTLSHNFYSSLLSGGLSDTIYGIIHKAISIRYCFRR
jgi:hypothetical protein